ncbi:MAG: histidinol-phosphate aminotransferase family protein [Bacteroidales bacterium]|nr:histidinol-phosphate aminotransferase family protein [Bacteroidales bacterium]
MLNGHGNDIYKYKGLIKADFSSNIVYSGVNEGLLGCLKNCIGRIDNYPEPNSESLTVKIADYHHLNNDNILVTNGSIEAFYLVAQLFSGKQSLLVIPSFAEYEDAARIHHHKLSFTTFEMLHSAINQSFDLVWIGNPNNPDGKSLSKNEILENCHNFPQTTFVIDEAYADLCLDFESAIELVSQVDNLIVIRSLTKAFAIPGIRLGYVVTSLKIQESLKRIKSPWTVNTLALEAGKYIIDNMDALKPDGEFIAIQSKNLQKELSSINFIAVVPSLCNFFLCKILKGTASGLKAYLIEKHGFLIRDASNFRGLNDKHFRIAIQNTELNKKLVDAIRMYYNAKLWSNG